MTASTAAPSLALGFAISAALAATAPLGSGKVAAGMRVALAIAMTPAVASATHAAAAADVIAATLRAAAAGLCATAVLSCAKAAGSVADACATASPLPASPIDAASSGPFARLYDLTAACAFLHAGGIARLAALVEPHASTLSLTAHGAAMLAGLTWRATLAIAAPALFAQAIGALVSGMVARVAVTANALTIAPPITLGLVLLAIVGGVGVFCDQIASLAVAACRVAGRW